MADTRSSFENLTAREVAAASAAADRRERCIDLHGYGCTRAECGRRSVSDGEITGLSAFLPQRTP